MSHTLNTETVLSYARSLSDRALHNLHEKIHKTIRDRATESLRTVGVGTPVVIRGVSLPPDIVNRIYKYLSPEDIAETRLVCKALYHTARNCRNWTRLPKVASKRLLSKYWYKFEKRIDILSKYPHLEELYTNGRTCGSIAKIQRLAAVVPHVSQLHMQVSEHKHKDAIDLLVALLPIKRLTLACLPPTDLSNLVFLEIEDVEETEDMDQVIRSETLRHLKMPITDLQDNEILEHCPNLEVLLLPCLKLCYQLVHPKLKRLAIRALLRGGKIKELVSLEHLEIAHVQYFEGMANDSVSVIHGFAFDRFAYDSRGESDRMFPCLRDYYPGLKMQYLNIDWPYLNIDWPDLNIMSGSDVEEQSLSSPVEHLIATSINWIKLSYLPNLEELTLDWYTLDQSEIIQGLKDLRTTTWVDQIRHLNLRMHSDCHTKKREDDVHANFNHLLLKMARLETFRSEGFALRVEIHMNPIIELREITFEQIVMTVDTKFQVQEDMKEYFTGLEFLRVSTDCGNYLVEFENNLNYHLQVPLLENYKASARLKEMIQRGDASYYTTLPKPWFANNRIEDLV